MVIVAGLVIAGCSLAAGVAGGLSDRKRPFSMLRLAGAPLGLLRRVVVLESSVPLLVAAVVAIGRRLRRRAPVPDRADGLCAGAARARSTS